MRALRHRGPDGEGLFEHPPGSDTRAVTLAHCRLAIIDPSPAAAQPMVSQCGRYVIVLNGEIYNYLELRAELEARGHAFRTRSDTEVLLEGYRVWGRGVLGRLVGMFAFAILDRTDHALLLARDCFAMKPLYYASSARGFGFASEAGALLSMLGLKAEADDQGVADYLAHGLTDHRSETLFAGVRALPAASCLAVSLRDSRVPEPERYWSPAVDRVDDRPAATVARDLRDRFLESIRLHLRADATVGTLLSGGIDSSAIVMAMREVGGDRLDIRTFSYIPDAGAISEERWIDDVNAAARAIPHKLRITREHWEQNAGAVAGHQGEPFGTLAVYAQSELCRRASESGVRVLLDGQGADEMLAGYASLRSARLAGHIRRGEWRRAWRFASAVPGDGAGTRQRVGRYLEVARLIAPDPVVNALRGARRSHALLNGTWLDARGVRPQRAWRPSGTNLLHQRLHDSLWTSSLPALLRYSDRSSMMHGVESRLPFLTRELVEFALALPDHLLIADDGLGKSILRLAMRGLVPDSVLDRREKIGFAVPLDPWLRGSRYVEELVTHASTLRCVDAGRVAPWIASLKAGRPLALGPTFLMWRLIGLASGYSSTTSRSRREIYSILMASLGDTRAARPAGRNVAPTANVSRRTLAAAT